MKMKNKNKKKMNEIKRHAKEDKKKYYQTKNRYKGIYKLHILFFLCVCVSKTKLFYFVYFVYFFFSFFKFFQNIGSTETSKTWKTKDLWYH